MSDPNAATAAPAAPDAAAEPTLEDLEMEDAGQTQDSDLDEDILALSTADILTRKRLLENDSRIMKSEHTRLTHEQSTMAGKIKENEEKIANNRYAGSLRADTSADTLGVNTKLQTASIPCRKRR